MLNCETLAMDVTKSFRRRQTYPADNDRHGSVGTHSNQEQCCILEITVVVNRNKDCEASNANTDWEDCEGKTVLQAIRAPRNQHGEAECCRPWRHAVQLCLDRAVAVALDDLWREVRVSVRGHDETEVHEAA